MPDDETADPSFGPWSTENYQLASLIEAVHELQRTLVQVNTDQPVEPVPPMPRPRVKRASDIAAESEFEARVAYLAEFRERVNQKRQGGGSP